METNTVLIDLHEYNKLIVKAKKCEVLEEEKFRLQEQLEYFYQARPLEQEITSEQSKVDIKTLCLKISRLLKNNYNPHTTVVITDNSAKIVQDEWSVPNI